MEIQLSSKFGHQKLRPPVSRPVRFARLGERANHPLTISMRQMKESLGMTTKELARAVNRFEKEFGKPQVDENHTVSSAFIPMKSILLSSYLQGWVMQDNFIESFHGRLEAYWKHAMSLKKNVVHKNIRPIMDGWFKKLGIDVNDEVVSPHRELARRISHLCKRAVVCEIDGKFQLGGDLDSEYGWYAIVSDDDKIKKYVYRKTDDVLIVDGSHVSMGDVVQYTKEIICSNNLYSVSQENQINQSTYYRWYRSNKMPRSRFAIDFIDQAVEEASKEVANNF